MATIADSIENLITDLTDFRDKLTEAGIEVSEDAGFRECVDALEFSSGSPTSIDLPYCLTRVDQLYEGATESESAYIEKAVFINGEEFGSNNNTYKTDIVYQDDSIYFSIQAFGLYPGFYDLYHGTQDGENAYMTAVIKGDWEIEEAIEPFPYGGIPRVYVDSRGYLYIAEDFETTRTSTNVEDFTVELKTSSVRPGNGTVEMWIKEKILFKAITTTYSPEDLQNLYAYDPYKNSLDKVDFTNMGYTENREASYLPIKSYSYAFPNLQISYYMQEVANEDRPHLVDFSGNTLGKILSDHISVRFDNEPSSNDLTLNEVSLPQQVQTEILNHAVLDVNY